ncbi:hypothetical protein [Mycobacterium sp. RTGN5]|uniref:hypothetical protein n=1 Tax=Mycobacterium sp. RTGN5 TaxID=3016522 RepID=UPI0029C758B0|nr:hypothetical protein [Mycobacterium sp. RTGN5]
MAFTIKPGCHAGSAEAEGARKTFGMLGFWDVMVDCRAGRLIETGFLPVALVAGFGLAACDVRALSA